MADVLDALGVKAGDCVAVVGAGGKTTLCWRMVQAFASRGERVVFTTTTKIWQPAPGAFDYFAISPHPQPLPILRQAQEEGRFETWGEEDWRTACIASNLEDEPSDAPVPHTMMPAVQTKLIGFSPNEICAMHSSFPIPNATFIVEADGARGLLLKAPAENEPATPPCADVVCVVACLDAIGRPLDERSVHRVERVERIAGMQAGSLITATVIVDVLCHPEGGLKNMPAHAQRVAVLTQHSHKHADTAPLLAQLRERGYHRAVTGNW